MVSPLGFAGEFGARKALPDLAVKVCLSLRLWSRGVRSTNGGYAGPDAVLFDFDGTLVSSDNAHLSAFNEALSPFQRQLSVADYEACAGRSNSAIFQDLLHDLSAEEIAALGAAKEAIYLRRLDVITEQPGVTPLLTQLAAARKDLAVVTNAPRAVVTEILQRLRLDAFFKVIVCIDDVANGKPDPEPYRTALQRLAVGPARAIAVEDTLTGRRSAEAAGLRVVMFGKRDVTSALDPPAFRAIAHMPELIGALS